MFRMMALIVCNEGGGGALPARVGLSSECHFHFGVSPSLQAWDPNSILLAIEKVSQTSQTKTCLRWLHALIWYYVTFGVHCTMCRSEHWLSLLRDAIPREKCSFFEHWFETGGGGGSNVMFKNYVGNCRVFWRSFNNMKFAWKGTFEALMVKFGGEIGTLYQIFKNAFKKHPLQNRTNVQSKRGGGGGSKAFWTMLKKTALFLKDGFPYSFRHYR